MCEQNSDTLERTLKVVDDTFGSYIKQMKWLNFGGGHHITRSDYDIETLIRCIQFAQDTYGVQVYLEPGEAVALNTGYLISTVLDTIENGMHLAILDTSAACHMPDVLKCLIVLISLEQVYPTKNVYVSFGWSYLSCR